MVGGGPLRVLFWTTCVLGTVSALSCYSCEESSCPPVEHCRAGVDLDVCGCCLVCAQHRGQECGGPWEYLGRCGDGLYCHLNDTSDMNARGICRDCDRHLLVSGCNLLHGTCYCTQGCSGHRFQYDSHEQCSIHVPLPDCSEALCPASEPCPNGMTSVSVPPPPGECCATEQRCVCSGCFPSELVCPVGYSLSVLDDGAVYPRDTPVPEEFHMMSECCPRYYCKSLDSTQLQRKCTYRGEDYRNGETFKLGHCETCSCSEGLIICNLTSCPGILDSCGYQHVPEGECCPVCVGCLTNKGDSVLNGEHWDEDDCTRCMCVGGETICVASSCLSECGDPVKLPGICCPVCSDKIYPVENTTKHGSQLCPFSICELKCRSGLWVDEDGCELCICKEDYKPACPSFLCHKSCPHGYKVDQRGCPRCRCKKCPSMTKCDKKCGTYVTSSAGCPLCACEDGNSLPPATGTNPSADLVCVDGRGTQRRRSGDQWFDGCRQCFCSGGKTLCSLITCPPLSCTQPVKNAGECCPSCPESGSIVPKINVTTPCVIDTVTYHSGDTWNMDKCTKCLCHQGRAFCEPQHCPPVLCETPIRLANSCCNICPGSQRISIESGASAFASCMSLGEREYSHGDVWQPSECRSCVCSHGQIYCFSVTCPIPRCTTPLVLKKGQCCPVCAGREVSRPSVSDGRLCPQVAGEPYHHGQTWRESCKRCLCLDGISHCELLKCSEAALSCSHCYSNSDGEIRSGKAGPTNDPGQDEQSHVTVGLPHFITVASLLFIFAVIIVALIVLIFIMKRRKRQSLKHIPKVLELRSINNNQKDVRPRRPKSTNLEFLSADTYRYANSIQKDKECFKPLVERSENEYVHC